jgi:hypothetical protein
LLNAWVHRMQKLQNEKRVLLFCGCLLKTNVKSIKCYQRSEIIPRRLPQNPLLVGNVRSLKLCPLLVRHDHATREERHRYGAQILASPIRQAKGTEPFYQNRF